MFKTTGAQRTSGTRPWPDVLLRAQRAIALELEQAAAPAGLSREAYFDWLCGEAAIAVLCADAMDVLSAWHVNDARARSTAQAWAGGLRELARLAAADLRVLGARMPSTCPLPEAWSGFLAGASGSQRAGEALGAIALYSRVLPGRAAAALDAMAAAPFARAASRYLARRRRGESDAERAQRDELLGAYAATAIAAGAQRAAAWTLDAVAIAQTRSRG
jgi:hypothetical protein